MKAKKNKPNPSLNQIKIKGNLSLLSEVNEIYKSQNLIIGNNQTKLSKNHLFYIKTKEKSDVNHGYSNNNCKYIISKSNKNENKEKINLFKTEIDSQNRKLKLPILNKYTNNTQKNSKKTIIYTQYQNNYPYTPYNKTENTNFPIQKSFDSSVIPVKENIYKNFPVREFLLLSKINKKPFK